jgi:hypothetical protein
MSRYSRRFIRSLAPQHEAWRTLTPEVPPAPAVPGKGRKPAGYRTGISWRLFDGTAQALDQKYGWDALPRLLALLVLVGVRNILRQQNLYDTDAAPQVDLPPLLPPTGVDPTGRSVDGSYNDLSAPRMGQAGARFGRNVPLWAASPDEATLLVPNPREVSRRVMTRTTFQPATSVNTLAASWIQFMVKDWLSHGTGDVQRGFTLPLQPDDPWPAPPLIVPRTVADPTRPVQDDSGFPPTFVNVNTAWWDGSSIYGSNQVEQDAIRSHVDGKLNITPDGLVAMPDDPRLDPSQVPGFWLGLAMMGTLFCREHNAVCDALKAAYPHYDDEEVFQRARLVVCALIAKIHTVQWTPAIIAHPTTVTALRANWFGLLGERVQRAFGLTGNEVFNGIPGSGVEHFGVPYSLTEEFSIVYRMHPLIPDDYGFRSAADDRPLAQHTLRDLSGPNALGVMAAIGMPDLFYSFGVSNPGAIVLNNFPRFLQEFLRPDGKLTDLAATDILRTRELGVPRYNQFRRLLHLKPVDSFEELADDRALAATLADLYGGDVEQLDTIVGMFAEKRPAGFAFSDTAFRIFILMASRRINSDRFLAEDFRPDVYTQTGFDWVRDNDMTSVLLRHHPQLRASLRGIANPFAPWRRVS